MSISHRRTGAGAAGCGYCSEMGGMVASGGRRMMEEAGHVSPEELDVDMQKHLAAQKRLRKKKRK